MVTLNNGLIEFIPGNNFLNILILMFGLIILFTVVTIILIKYSEYKIKLDRRQEDDNLPINERIKKAMRK